MEDEYKMQIITNMIQYDTTIYGQTKPD